MNYTENQYEATTTTTTTETTMEKLSLLSLSSSSSLASTSSSSSSLSSSLSLSSTSPSSSSASSSASAANLPIIYTALEICVAICAILGNLLVIVVFVQDRRLRKITNFYIISLSVADLLVGAIGIPSAILTRIGIPRNSIRLCITMLSLLVVLCTISILNLVAVSLDRYWAILHPLDYHKKISEKTALVIVCGCWILGIVIGFLPLFGWNNGHLASDACYFIPIMNYDFLMFLYFVTIVFPALVMAFFYIRIYIVVVQQLSLNKVRQLSSNEFSLDRKLKSTSRPATPDSLSFAVPQSSAKRCQRQNKNGLLSSAPPRITDSLRPLHRDRYIGNRDFGNSIISSPQLNEIIITASTASTAVNQSSFDNIAISQSRHPKSKINANLHRRVECNSPAGRHLQSSSSSSIASNLNCFSGYGSNRSSCSRKSSRSNNNNNNNINSKQSNNNGMLAGRWRSLCSVRRLSESLSSEEMDASKRSIRSITFESIQPNDFIRTNGNANLSNNRKNGAPLRLSYSRREVKKAQKLFVIVVFFMLCWLPLYTSNTVQAFCPRCPVPPTSWLDFLIILSHINSAGSPFLYAFHMKDFRLALRRLICEGAINKRKLRELRRAELFSISSHVRRPTTMTTFAAATIPITITTTPTAATPTPTTPTATTTTAIIRIGTFQSTGTSNDRNQTG